MTLLPTPQARDDKGAPAVGYNTGNLHHALDPLPTPRTSDTNGPGSHGEGGDDRTVVADPSRWGRYAVAIARHEQVFGRPVPEPRNDGRLSARFVEWMMMLPEGWVTDVLPRRPALRCLGNGVVPAQATAAVAALCVRLGAAA